MRWGNARAQGGAGASDPAHAGSPAPGRGVLIRYRVMAFTTAVLLVVLVFVGIPLQVAAGAPGVVNVVGTMHGFLYIVYLVTAFELTWRLRIPKWQMALVLLAGTVPLCAFVAERVMTRRFEAARSSAGDEGATGAPRRGRRSQYRQRWLSSRALVLHAEVLVVAPGCVAAGWWQATQALAGNELSWVYSVEWPVFALIAIWVWWHLVHEDPEDFEARRWRSSGRMGAPEEAPDVPSAEVEVAAAQWAAVLSVAVWFEFAIGIVALVTVPFDRPSGWLPPRGVAIYGMHASVGVLVALGAVAFVVRVRRLGRTARIAGWTGAIAMTLSGAGGLMTAAASLERVFGVALMFVGASLAGAAYLVPVVVLRRARTHAGRGEPAADGSPTQAVASWEDPAVSPGAPAG